MVLPLLVFAVLTDIQFADKAPVGRRDYRASLYKLKSAAAEVNAARPAFAIQLGDLIDGGEENLTRILPVWKALTVPRHSVLGNHDLCLPRKVLLDRLGMPAGWYDFAQGGWRFVVLDGMDVSIPAGSPDAPRMLEELRAKKSPNAQDWNGAVSAEQLRWLHATLGKAAAKRERVIVFCHFPIVKEATTPPHLLWNADAVLNELDGVTNVMAFMSGHDHKGGYALRRGVHHVTLPGMVESGAQNSWTLVEVYADRLELRGLGGAPSRTLK